MQSGAPTFGTPEPGHVMTIAGALARRLGVPFRSGGGLCASKFLTPKQLMNRQIHFRRRHCRVNFYAYTAAGLKVDFQWL